jgi:hypothetical protein
MSNRPPGRLRPTGTPAALRAPVPDAAGYRDELARANVRRAFTFQRSEILFVGPFVAPGRFVPFKVARQERIVKGFQVHGAPPAPTTISTLQRELTVNDPAARVLATRELESAFVRLVDAQGTPYVQDVPALRCTNNAAPPAASVLQGPAPFVVHPMLTQMNGGGVVLYDPTLFGTGINFYCAVELFYSDQL